jgi:hypothetical protein
MHYRSNDSSFQQFHTTPTNQYFQLISTRPNIN